MMLVDIENDLEYIRHILSEHPQLSVQQRLSSYKGIRAGNIITYVPCDDIGHVAIDTDLKSERDINTLFDMIMITSNGFTAFGTFFKTVYIDGGVPDNVFRDKLTPFPKDQVFHHEGMLEIYRMFSSKYKALLTPLIKDNPLSQVQARYNSERNHLEIIVGSMS